MNDQSIKADEIVEALRAISTKNSISTYKRSVCKDAAALIENQAARLAAVTAERDDLLEYAEAQMECEMCKNDAFCPVQSPTFEDCASCGLKPGCPCHPCKWEWRGPQGAGEGGA